MYVITHEFQKKCSIRFKSSNLGFKGQKVALMCMLLHLSFKKIVPFVLKVVIWALKAKKWPCPPLPIKAQNTEKKLGIDLSFSSSLVCAGFRRKKLTYLSYHPTFSVEWHFKRIGLKLEEK